MLITLLTFLGYLADVGAQVVMERGCSTGRSGGLRGHNIAKIMVRRHSDGKVTFYSSDCNPFLDGYTATSEAVEVHLSFWKRLLGGTFCVQVLSENYL